MITQYTINVDLKEKRMKTQTPKAILLAKKKIVDDTSVMLYEEEISILKKKLKETEVQLENTEKKLNDRDAEIAKLNHVNEAHNAEKSILNFYPLLTFIFIFSK